MLNLDELRFEWLNPFEDNIVVAESINIILIRSIAFDGKSRLRFFRRTSTKSNIFKEDLNE